MRRVLYALLLAAMILGGIETFFFRIFAHDRGASAAQLAAAPDRAAPGYAAFLREVRARTPEDARIAVVVPMRRWSGGYEYAYYRASYALAGREVIPLVDRDDSAHLERVRDAEWVASWGMEPRIPGFARVWSGSGGTLLRRAGR